MTTTSIRKTSKTPQLRVADPLDPVPARHLEPWVSKKQLAAHLGRSTRWVELAQRDRGLPYLKEGQHGTCWYRISLVEGWMHGLAAAA